MRTRRVIADAVVIAATLAVVVGVYVLGRGERPKTARHPREATAVRALMTGMVIYAQNNRDAFPPPEQVTELLLTEKMVRLVNESGILPEEIFEPPRQAPNEPAFYAVVLPGAAGRWSNSFRECVPVVYANPAFFDGRSTVVVFSDNHTDTISWADLQKQLADLKATAVPVR